MSKDNKKAQLDEKNEQEREMNSEIKEEKLNEKSEIEKLKDEFDQLYDKYLRLMSEFDNYRRRTIKEKQEVIKNASEDLLVLLLPVLDDFERALESVDKNEDKNFNPDGIKLVYNKLKNTLEKQGLKVIESKGSDFDPEIHEAIVKVAAPSKKMKGKVMEVIEKGYVLNEKIIRYSKVVVGE